LPITSLHLPFQLAYRCSKSQSSHLYRIPSITSATRFHLQASPKKNHDPNLVQYLNNTNPKPRRHVPQTLTIPKHGRDSNEDREEEKESYHTIPSRQASLCMSFLLACQVVHVSSLNSSQSVRRPDQVNHVRKTKKCLVCQTGVSGAIRTTRFLLKSKLFSE
jgi:hypothetical protein